MAVTLAPGSSSGTTSQAVGSTPQTLLNIATAGTFTLHIDLALMTGGDIVELRIWQKILSAGTLRVAYYQIFVGAQPTDNILQISVPIANDLVEADSVRFTILQTAGTARAFPWKVISY